MFGVLLTLLLVFTSARADSTITLTNCGAKKLPEAKFCNFSYNAISKQNNGIYYFAILPDTKENSNVTSQKFIITPENGSPNIFNVTITNMKENGPNEVLAKNLKLTDNGCGEAIVQSGEGSEPKYTLFSVCIYSSPECFAYAACSPTGNDNKNLDIFTLCKCKLSKTEMANVAKVYEKYGASMKQLQTPQC